MKPDCLFCKLANDPDTTIWKSTNVAAFKDIHPKAKTHILIVPKEHVTTLNDVQPELASDLIAAVQQVAEEQQVAAGYRVQINVGRKGGQEIDHVHLHLLAD